MRVGRDAVAKHAIPPKYALCGKGDQCGVPTDVPKKKGWVVCKSDKKCTNAATCDCHMFAVDTSQGHEDDDWKHVGDPDDEVKKEDMWEYRCFCVKLAVPH